MTAKEQVLQVYPGAYCTSYFKQNNYFVKAQKATIGTGTTPQKAWQNALTTIKKKTNE